MSRFSERLARIEKLLEEQGREPVTIRFAEFARPRRSEPKQSPESVPRPVPPPALDEPDSEPQCPICRARTRPHRGERLCPACMSPREAK